MLKHSIVATVDRFRYNRPGILIVLRDHITVHILSMAALVASAICTLQIHTNVTINTELTDGINREDEQSVERHGDHNGGGLREQFIVVLRTGFYQRSWKSSFISLWSILGSFHITPSGVFFDKLKETMSAANSP